MNIILPGCLLHGPDGAVATLAALLADPATGGIVGLTGANLNPLGGRVAVFGEGSPVTEAVGETEAREDVQGGRAPLSSMVTVIRFRPDAVLVQEPGIQGTQWKPVSPLEAVGLAVGRLGGATPGGRGTVSAALSIVHVDLGDGRSQELHGTVEVSSRQPFAARGDGGAMVLTDSGGAVGILVGGNAQVSFVAPLHEVLGRTGFVLLPMTAALEFGTTAVP